MARLTVQAFIPLLFLSGCLFETTKPVVVLPDLSIGNQWLYRFRGFLKNGDGTSGDTATHFIHYAITGDSSIAGIRYRILSEEDLAVFNTDQGLIKTHSLFAVAMDDSGTKVNLLRGESYGSGRLPFKSTAGSAFDTSHFEDEVTALKLPLSIGLAWSYREPGQPFGHGAAVKTYLGEEEIRISGATLTAMKFRLEVAGLEYVRSYEWYRNGTKVFSSSTIAANAIGRDSLHSEEEYVGKRDFSKDDTLAILAAMNRQP